MYFSQGGTIDLFISSLFLISVDIIHFSSIQDKNIFNDLLGVTVQTILKKEKDELMVLLQSFWG
ncbi:hypothetical protein [Bacillus toyonensis]|uniref:hypothetical protein n=1 Tax=Bacillus toyonensis TaxID=155322 RepID=UPI001C3F3B77|nr:hypothetical protein [Bacillus toyonensis]